MMRNAPANTGDHLRFQFQSSRSTAFTFPRQNQRPAKCLTLLRYHQQRLTPMAPGGQAPTGTETSGDNSPPHRPCFVVFQVLPHGSRQGEMPATQPLEHLKFMNLLIEKPANTLSPSFQNWTSAPCTEHTQTRGWGHCRSQPSQPGYSYDPPSHKARQDSEPVGPEWFPLYEMASFSNYNPLQNTERSNT